MAEGSRSLPGTRIWVCASLAAQREDAYVLVSVVRLTELGGIINNPYFIDGKSRVQRGHTVLK